jgi:hypothetical protein
MKQTISIFLIVISMNIYGQALKDTTTLSEVNVTNNEGWAYQLYPTENMYTFLKLDTRNGRIWQVQFSMDDDRFESFLNLIPLVTDEDESNGRFELFPTQNMYTFILLDRINGEVYQVQWSQEYSNRLVIPIN